MTTKEKVIIGAVGLVITGVMAYTIYDYNDVIKTNNELIERDDKTPFYQIETDYSL